MISVEELIKKLQLAPRKAEKILDLILGKSDPQKFSPVKKWVDQCYHEPVQYEQIMKAIDQVLRTAGVEALFENELPHGDKASEPFALYANTGDSYTDTIVYLIVEDDYIVSSWAETLDLQKKKTDEEAEGTHHIEIIEGLSECFWALAWSSHVEEVNCSNLSGCEITEVMPEVPDLAKELAEKAAREIIANNSDCSLDLLYRIALRNNINEGFGFSDKRSGPKHFGYCLAHEILGTGVTWADDNAEHGFQIPRNESFTDELSSYAEEHCEDCEQES